MTQEQRISLGAKIRGTCAWMAPEIVVRPPGANVTTKADVYSFAVVLWELISPGKDLLAAWETAAFGQDEQLRHMVVIPRWASRGIRPSIPDEIAEHDPTWGHAIARCWHTDPRERPSFSEIQREIFNDDASKSMALDTNAVSDWLSQLTPQPEPQQEPPLPSKMSLYVQSETEVTLWLQEHGLGRIADRAAADERYCDLDSYEDLASGPQCNLDSFVRYMGLTQTEHEMLLKGLVGLHATPGPRVTDVSRPASPSCKRPARDLSHASCVDFASCRCKCFRRPVFQ